MNEDQLRILRAMTPEQRLQAANQLYWSAWELKKAALRKFNPDWPAEKSIRKAAQKSTCATSVQCSKHPNIALITTNYWPIEQGGLAKPWRMVAAG